MVESIISKVGLAGPSAELLLGQPPELIRRVSEIFSHMGISTSLQHKLALSLMFVILFILLQILLRRIVYRNAKDVRQHYYWSRTVTYGTTFLGLVILGMVWIRGLQSFATFFGLVSAGVALSLRDIIANLAGWMFIILRQPFQVGDRIEIGAFRGDVIDVSLFQFTILEIGNWVDADQSTGRIIDIPNGLIMSQGLANYTKGFEYIWHEIPILVTFESNWKKAKAILDRIAHEKAESLSPDAKNQLNAAARKYMIFYRHLTPIVYTSVKDSGVMLTIRYMTKPRQRRTSTEAIWEAILDAFALETDIELAYPTTRFYTQAPLPPASSTNQPTIIE
ncbi:MAG TPA: mechanosensitive ion channel family protein [Candidatus Sumerlaeota bacterium]|nr:mechanosensitive ion channel family protein [Candidatus Sumerlaeota bacterium]